MQMIDAHPHRQRGTRGRRALLAVLAVTLTAWLGASYAQEARPAGSTGGTLVIGQLQEPASMVLAESSTPVSAQYYTAMLINEPLVKVDHDFDLVPGLLAEVPTVENGAVSEDRRVYTLRPREGVTWEDGTPVTADDIVFTWQWLIDPANVAYATHGWEKVESVDVVDPLTVTVTLSEPFAFWLDEAVINMGIAPKHALEGVSKDQFNQRPIGNGPFKLVEWRTGDVLIFERNAAYSRGPAYLDRVAARIIPDSNSLAAAVMAGDVHMAIGLLTANVPQLQSTPGVNVVTTTWP